jgi:hypothetical protein
MQQTKQRTSRRMNNNHAQEFIGSMFTSSQLLGSDYRMSKLHTYSSIISNGLSKTIKFCFQLSDSLCYKRLETWDS